MNTVIAVHMVFAVPALPLGGVILSRPPGHKLFGRYGAAFMAVTAVSSFWIYDTRDGFSPIHVLSGISLVSVATAIFAGASSPIGRTGKPISVNPNMRDTP